MNNIKTDWTQWYWIIMMLSIIPILFVGIFTIDNTLFNLFTMKNILRISVLVIPIVAIFCLKFLTSSSKGLLSSYDDEKFEEIESYVEEEKVTRKSAIKILRKRFANSEITKEEYTEKMARL